MGRISYTETIFADRWLMLDSSVLLESVVIKAFERHRHQEFHGVRN